MASGLGNVSYVDLILAKLVRTLERADLLRCYLLRNRIEYDSTTTTGPPHWLRTGVRHGFFGYSLFSAAWNRSKFL